jgi:hypothetical protein
MLILRKRLGQDVGDVDMSRDVAKVNFARFYALAYEVVAYIDVFSPCVVDRVTSESDGALVVTMDDGGRGGSATEIG